MDVDPIQRSDGGPDELDMTLILLHSDVSRDMRSLGKRVEEGLTTGGNMRIRQYSFRSSSLHPSIPSHTRLVLFFSQICQTHPNTTNPQVDDGAKGVAVGNTIAIIGEEGDDPSGADALAKEDSSSGSAPAEPDAKPASSEKSEPTSSKASSGESKSSAAPQKDDSASGAKNAGANVTPQLGTPGDEKKYGSGNAGTEGMKAPELGGDKPKFFASPLARKIALEKGVPLG